MRLEVGIDLGGEQDAAELDAAALQLRDELLQLDVQAVERQEEAAPDGTRGVGAAVLETLIVSGSKDLVDAVVAAVAGWFSRRQSGSVSNSGSVTLTLDGDTITIDNPSDEDQRRLLELFVRAHTVQAP